MDENEKKPAAAEEQLKDLRELCRVWGPFEAELIKSFLAGHGILSLVRGRMVPFIYPFTVDGMAEFKIFVSNQDFEKAKELMASMPGPEEEGSPDETK